MIRASGLMAPVLALIFALFCAPALAAPTQFPPLTGRVVDNAHVLTPEVQAQLTTKLAALEQTTSRQLVVVTLPSLGGDDIEDYGNRLLRAWGIGQKATNNGALFIIVPSEHKVRIEVGYGLERRSSLRRPLQRHFAAGGDSQVPGRGCFRRGGGWHGRHHRPAAPPILPPPRPQGGPGQAGPECARRATSIRSAASFR